MNLKHNTQKVNKINFTKRQIWNGVTESLRQLLNLKNSVIELEEIPKVLLLNSQSKNLRLEMFQKKIQKLQLRLHKI